MKHFKSLTWTNLSKTPSKRLIYLASFLLPMLIMLLVWFFNQMFPFGNYSPMAVDFSQQYIGFYGYLKHTILSGDWSAFFYSFSKSIGGEMIGVLGYYIISPFNLLYILLPLSQFKWAVFFSIWLRYGAIGLSFAYLLIKRYRGMDSRPWLVPLLATAYALSGMLVSYQMNPIFYDAMYMLPLVIVALEELIDGGKPFKYIVLLALTLTMQFYMGYMICLFIILYTLYYASPYIQSGTTLEEKVSAYLKPIFKVAFFSVLAATATSALLYPIFINLLNSKGAYEAPMTFSWLLQINPFDILSKLMIGGFDNESWSAGPSLPNLFVGGLALIGAALYFPHANAHPYKKNGAKMILSVFFLSMVHEFTSKIWHMGQNPAGFFYRFSWIVSFFLVLLAYQALRERFTLTNKQLLKGIGFSLFATWFVSTHSYTYIYTQQPEKITQLITQYRFLFIAFIASFLLFIAFRIWTSEHLNDKKRVALLGLCTLLLPTAIFLMDRGYLSLQIPLTLLVWLTVLFVLYFKPTRMGWFVLSILTVFELGYNALLSQMTIGYPNAYTFTNATTELEALSKVIAEQNNPGFYRVGSDFIYSKNDPLLVSYPGTSNFSSNLEKSTINLFNAFGDVGGNAATYLANGTVLSDTLFGIRYYMSVKEPTAADLEEHKNDWHFFYPNSTRTDITDYYKPIYENDRFIIYENPNVLSPAFATNNATRNIQFGLNNPVANQNIILNSIAGTDKQYFEFVGIPEPETVNLEKDTSTGATIYRRIDNTQPGTIKIAFTPQTDMTYYFQAPLSLRSSMGNMNITLNNNWYRYTQSFDQVQLWNLTHNALGQPVELKIDLIHEDQIDLTNMGIVRADHKAIQEVMKQTLDQDLEVTSWSSTKIEGSVTVSDDNTVMMTSIPYSDGWTVTVDGQKVETIEAWESLLSFPITEGKHDIVMSFRPQGLLTGTVISILAILFVIRLYLYDKKHPDSHLARVLGHS
ncbi:glycosyltransferase PgfM1 [Streptococcus rifensis]